MHLTIAYSKIKKRNLVLINNAACQRETLSERLVGFFIPVSSLKVFGHSIHSERRRIYIGNQYKLYRMTPLSYHRYSVSGSPSQQGGGIPLKLLCLFSSILVHHENFSETVGYYLINEELMTFSNKIQAKTFTWPDISFYAR